VNGNAGIEANVAIAADGDEPVDKIGLHVGIGQRVPAQPIGRRGHLVERRAA